jgi:hypothetical protein
MLSSNLGANGFVHPITKVNKNKIMYDIPLIVFTF